MKYILFLLSILYLYLEIRFNIILVHLVSNDAVHAYVNVDDLGRSVSAIGLMLLSLRVVVAIKIKAWQRALIAVLLLPLIGYGTFEAQEKIVEHITKITPMEAKKDQSYTYIFKRGVANGAIKYPPLEEAKELTDAEKSVVKMSTVYWGSGYPAFMEFAKNIPESQYKREMHGVYKIDFDNNMTYYHGLYESMHVDMVNMKKRYGGSYDLIEYHHNTADRKIDKAWEKKLEVEKSILNRYYSLAKNMHKREAKALRSGLYRKSLPYELKARYRSLSNCSSTSCFESISKILVRTSNLRGLDYTVKSNCQFGKKSQFNKVNFKSKDGSFTHTNDNHYGLFSNYKSIQCNIDLRPAEKYALDKMYKELKKDYGITDFSARTKSEFANSQASSDAISNLIQEHSGIKMPKGWNRSDKEGFYNAFRLNSLGDLYKEHKEKMIEEYGFYVPKGLSEAEFFAHKGVKKMIAENASIFDYKGLIPSSGNYGSEKFRKYYNEIVPKNMTDFYFKQIENSDSFVDATFKITIVPIVAICFSLFFGFLNLSMIVKDFIGMTGLLKNKGISLIVGLTISLMLLSVPLFTENNFIKSDWYQNKIAPSMKEHSVLGEFIYRWMVNGEIILYSNLSEGHTKPEEILLNKYNSLKEDLEAMGEY